MSSYRLIIAGESRSFPAPHAFLDAASADGQGIVVLGNPAAHDRQSWRGASFVAVELGHECLGVHGARHEDGVELMVGFARFRLGRGDPSPLVELVRQPWTSPAALEAAQRAFTDAGLVVAVCADFPGRIVDRLLRPYLNATLRRLDEGLASAADLDKTLQMGLGYPEGPIALLERTGLAEHFDATQALYEALGQEPYVPANAARVAKQRPQS